MHIGVVTGASSGLGREMMKYLDRCGLDEIWVNSRRKERLESLRREIKTPLRIFAGDIGADETIRAMETALEQMRPVILYLVCSAGIGKIGAAGTISAADRQAMISVNCTAAVAVTELCLPYMTRGSRIAEICSAAAFQPIPYLAVYAATKAFLYRYARALREEAACRGISVTAVCPYWIEDTEFIALARKTEDKPYFRRFPLAVTKAFAAETAWKDVQKGRAVSTPGSAAAFIRMASKAVPAKAAMAVCRLLFR